MNNCVYIVYNVFIGTYRYVTRSVLVYNLITILGMVFKLYVINYYGTVKPI